MGYAKGTSVPVDRSKAEIENLLHKYGASQFAYATSMDASLVGFRMRDRSIKFHLPMPEQSKYTNAESFERECRRRWRCLSLVIKAKLEAVESRITTFEEEFFAHVVLPGGMTVYELARENVAMAYKTQTPPDMLLGLGGGK